MYKTDNCTLTSIITLLCLNLVAFSTLTIFLISNSLNPIYQNKEKIVSSKQVNIEGYVVTDIYSTDHDSCRESYQPLFKQINTGPSLGYCREKVNNSTNFESINNSSDIKVGKKDDSLCSNNFEHIPGTSGLELVKLETKIACAKFVKADKLDYEISNSTTCLPGMQFCGKLTEKYFCLNDKVECPINGLHIIKGLEGFPEREKYRRIELGNNLFLYFSNEITNGYLITDDWAIGNINGICLNPNEVEVKEDTWEFWKRDYQKNCRSILSNLKYDLDYKLMSSHSWDDLLKNNDIDTFVKANNLNLNIDLIKNRQVGIFHKSKIYFNKDCKDYQSTYDKTFENFGSAVDYENIFILLTISVVLNSCAIIMLLVQLLIGCLLKNGKFVRNYTINWKMLVKSLTSVAFFNLIMIILLLFALLQIKKNKNHIINEIF